MGSEKFCLRWNDFESNISSAFRELRDDKDFFDVTLACDDEQIQAHKVILSACSTFFRNILRRNPHQHPLLYLKGVKHSDLQSVLNFMYHGEVNVAQEELNSFLAVAEELRVKGLTQNQPRAVNDRRESCLTPHKPPQTLKSPSHHLSSDKLTIPPPKRPRPPPPPTVPAPSYSTEDDIQEIVPVKSEPSDTLPPNSQPSHPIVPATSHLFSTQPSSASQALAHADTDDSLVFQEGHYEDYGQYEEQEYEGSMVVGASHEGNIQEMLVETETPEGKVAWKCVLCGKDFPHKCSGRRHIETMHFEAPSYECEVCGKVLKNKNTYQNHLNITHGIQKRPGFKSKNQSS